MVEETPPHKRVKLAEEEEAMIWQTVEEFAENISKNVEQFAVPSQHANLFPNIANVTKLLFDFAKKTEPEPLGLLPSLLVEGFDTEQLWEQLQTFNKPFLSFLHRSLPSLLPSHDDQSLDADEEGEDDEDEGGELHEENNFEEGEEDEIGEFEEEEIGEFEEDEIGEFEEDENEEEDEDGEGDENEKFFDEKEMEEFIKDAERREAAGSDYESEEDEDNEVADIFGNFDDDEEANKLRFSDYYSAPTKHSKQQEEMAKKIAKLEEQLISDKPWQMKGEVKSKERPKASLLEENLAFEHATKTAPIITIESTNELEKIIKKRIVEESWDDVVRIKDTIADFKPKKTVELDHEKSKQSLAEVYENEYLKSTGSLKEADALEKTKDELKLLFTRICYNLDALSNFHYAPKPVIRKGEANTNVAAIQMEEVIPTNVSDASLLAPEEIYDKRKGPIKGDSEVTTEEKTAKRRAHKEKAKKEKRRKDREMKAVEKLNPGLGNKYAKEKVEKELNDLHKSKNVSFVKGKDTASYASSNVFFNKLQENAKKEIENKRDNKKDEKKAKKSASSSVKL